MLAEKPFFFNCHSKLATKLPSRLVFIAVFSADGDDKLVDVFRIHSVQPLE